MLCNAVQCSAMQCNAARRWSFVRYVTGTIDEFGRWRRGMCASSVRSSSRSGRGRKLTLTSHHPTQHTGTILSVYLWTPSIVGGRARRSAVLVSSHTTTEWRRKSQSLSQSSAIPIPSLRRFRAPLPIITADHNSTGFFDASMACLVLSMTVYGSTVIRLWGFVRVALIRPTDQVTLMASRAWSHGVREWTGFASRCEAIEVESSIHSSEQKWTEMPRRIDWKHQQQSRELSSAQLIK